MSRCYTVEDIKKEISTEICRNKAFLEAWEKVTFPTKKDGKPFASMQKNICGAFYSPVSYALGTGEYEVHVNTHHDETGYISDSIYAYSLVKDLEDEKKLNKKQNFQPKERLLEQVYTYDLDDIKEAIANRISTLKHRISDLEKQFENAETVCEQFKTAYDAALKTLADSTAFSQDKTLYYLVKDFVIK